MFIVLKKNKTIIKTKTKTKTKKKNHHIMQELLSFFLVVIGFNASLIALSKTTLRLFIVFALHSTKSKAPISFDKSKPSCVEINCCMFFLLLLLLLLLFLKSHLVATNI